MNEKEREISGTDSSGVPDTADTADTPDVSGSAAAAKGAGKRGGWVKKLVLLIIVILIALVVYRVYTSSHDKGAEDVSIPVNVTVQNAEYGNIQVTTPLTGKIEPKDQISLNAMLQTKVTNVYVKEGDYVTAGTTLFTMDATQVQSGYTQAASQLQNAQNGLETAKTNLDRMNALYAEGAIPSQQLEQAQSAYDSAQQAVNQAQAAVSSAGSTLQNGSVTAPISGYITELNVKAGAYPPTGQVAATIADTRHLEIKTNVSEYLIGKIQENQPVDVVVKSLSDQPFKAHIINIAQAPSMGTLTYPITISIDDNQKGVMAGMFAEVQIVSDHRENVIVIPSEAVLIKSGETKVAILDEEQKAKFISVETGLDNGQIVEIVSGLNPGDVVITQGQNYVIEGEKPTVVDNIEE